MSAMSYTHSKVLGAVALVWLLAGCDDANRSLIAMQADGVTPAVDYTDLATVLNKASAKDGTIDPDELKECTEALDRQLAIMTVTGPTVTPDLLPAREDRLAYWLNARAAWAMKLLSAGEKNGKSNLREDMYEPFADYLTDVVKFFRDKRNIHFHTLEPLNEPSAWWWKENPRGASWTSTLLWKSLKS